jgi:hypothetical protein
MGGGDAAGNAAPGSGTQDAALQRPLNSDFRARRAASSPHLSSGFSRGANAPVQPRSGRPDRGAAAGGGNAVRARGAEQPAPVMNSRQSIVCLRAKQRAKAAPRHVPTQKTRLPAPRRNRLHAFVDGDLQVPKRMVDLPGSMNTPGAPDKCPRAGCRRRPGPPTGVAHTASAWSTMLTSWESSGRSPDTPHLDVLNEIAGAGTLSLTSASGANGGSSARRRFSFTGGLSAGRAAGQRACCTASLAGTPGAARTRLNRAHDALILLERSMVVRLQPVADPPPRYLPR